MAQTYQELIEKCIYKNPLALLAIGDDVESIRLVNSYLPFTTGFEIECTQDPLFELSSFTNIPDIVNVNIDSSEQRFQIPAGISGFICLWHITEQLKTNSQLNYGSGLHYHIDFGETACAKIRKVEYDKFKWILDELDSWKYIGTYNKRAITDSRTWVRVPTEHKTVEIRIGEMSFDYELIIKRIIHCNQIVMKMKQQLNVEVAISDEGIINKQRILDYLKTGVGSKFMTKLSIITKKLLDLKTIKEELTEPNKEQETQLITTRILKV